MRRQFDRMASNLVTYERTEKNLDDLGWERHVFKLDLSLASAIIRMKSSFLRSLKNKCGCE